ncbi:MAG: AAA family ATPase, partial [Solirubrobacterales bacterium]
MSDRLVDIKISNLLRLTAVHIDVSGRSMVTIAGNNGAGKTSVLDSIQMALGGKRAIPEKPVHEGASRGSVVLRTEDLEVRRTFSVGGGTSLTVVDLKTGSERRSPQGLLDSLVGQVGFDPLEFASLKPKEQVGRVRDLFGIDTSELEAKRDEAYEKRTETNREVKRLEGVVELTSMPKVALST